MPQPFDETAKDLQPAQQLKGGILVLDDEVNIQMLLKTVLEGEGYDVFATDDGYEAFERILEKNDIDVALVNMVMPIMSGRDFLRRLRELPEERRPLPVVITGRPANAAEEGYGELGVVAVVRKPFAIRNLLATVRGCLVNRRRNR